MQLQAVLVLTLVVLVRGVQTTSLASLIDAPQEQPTKQKSSSSCDLYSRGLYDSSEVNVIFASSASGAAAGT